MFADEYGAEEPLDEEEIFTSWVIYHLKGNKGPFTYSL